MFISSLNIKFCSNFLFYEFKLTSRNIKSTSNPQISHNVLIHMRNDGEWTRWEQSRVRIINRPQVWYMLLCDCNKETSIGGYDMKALDFELEMTNDESHFSHEYWGVLPTTVFALLVFSYLLGKTTLKLYSEIKKQEEYQTPLTPLLVAIVLEFLQLVLGVLHLI